MTTMDAKLDKPILTLERVSSGYDKTTIVRDVSFDVLRGDVVALLGANGAGKTTLLRTISGFLPALTGRIELLGMDVTRFPAHRRFASGMCHVPEGRGIFRSLTVRENLTMQSDRGNLADATERAVSAFPVLGSRMSQPAGTLSGGQQQMLAMAVAHVRNPDLILVDEASLGLAPIIVDEVFSFLRGITADGAALLLVDQFAFRVLNFSTRALVMRKGELVFSGLPSELMRRDLFATYVGAEDNSRSH